VAKPVPAWFNAAFALVKSAPDVLVFLSFAVDTSPIDAVILRVPGS
jgi:hypothetical protein